jgi:hypothetical protein
MDHFHQIPIVGKKDEPMLESWTTISVLAGVTSKIKLGTMITGIIYRHPSILAKIGATLDVLSKGRLFMGIGAAWNEEEPLAYGIPFPSVKEKYGLRPYGTISFLPSLEANNSCRKCSSRIRHMFQPPPLLSEMMLLTR